MRYFWTARSAKRSDRETIRRSKLIVLLIFFVMVGFVIYLGVTRSIEANQENFSYIKSMTKEEAVAMDNTIDSALKDIQGYAKVKSAGTDISEYADYMTFDQQLYIEAGSEDATLFASQDFVKMGMQGKSGVEVSFDDEIPGGSAMSFYAPVMQSDKVAGVLVGMLSQERMAKALQTECYGATATTFLVTSAGDIVFATSGYEDHIGTNLLTQYHAEDSLYSTSLDRLTHKYETFDNLANVLFNRADFGFTCKKDGLFETSYVESLDHDGFAVVETFPPSVTRDMVYSQLRLSLTMAIVVGLFVLLVLGRLMQKNASYQQMKVSAMQAEAANTAKSEFLSKMSHDMRTPLNGILGMVDIASRNSDDPEKTEDCLRKIKSSSHYLLNLVNEVLDLDTVEAGKIELNETEMYIPDLVEDGRMIVTNLVSGKNLALTVDNRLEHANIVADEMALQKISLNLLSNAVKYTPSGGTIHLSFWDEPDDDPERRRFFMRVQDNGIGMSEDFMERMFTPYEREEDVRISKTQGTGLGLPIAKALIDAMGGTIDVQSEVGEGSTFTVMLPLRLSTESGSARPSEPRLEMDQIDCSGYRCLLVEDNELNLEIASEILGLSGIEVETASDGREAVEKFDASPLGYYDIVFMDIQMPVLDGYAATRQIRRLRRSDVDEVPIVAMTANAYEKDVADALAAGMNGHLAKPVEQSKLAAVLCEYLEVKVR